MSLGGARENERLRLVETTPESLRWETRQIRGLWSRRVLRIARAAIAPLPIPARARMTAKEAHARLALKSSGIVTLDGQSDEADRLLLVPGVFWEADTTSRIKRFAAEGVTVRMIVYDLFPLRNPEWVTPGYSMRFGEALDQLVPVCDRIVTLSQEVADHVVDRYPESRRRVRVGVPTLQAHAPRSGPGSDHTPAPVPGPFLLALSTVEPRKNHRVILDAWRLAREDPRAAGAWLVIAGRRGWMADDIEAEITRDSVRLRILRLDYVRDRVVDALYRDCLATVHASFAEGFGLPVRESVVRGIPTLMSSTIPRDGLPDGTYRMFDPTDAEGLADLMVDAIAAGHVRTPIPLGDGTGWEPVLSALVD
jgi:glycosyltransferase involved in cell wall biosynthesis